MADASSVVPLDRVLRLRRAPEWDPTLLRPGLQHLQVVAEHHSGHRIRLGTSVLRQRARIPGHADASLGLAIELLENIPPDRPVDSEAAHRTGPQVLFREA